MTIQATPRLPTARTGHNDDDCPEEAQVSVGRSDRRVERTKRALIDALIHCMIDKGYEESSVADIVNRANVGRSTFYAHYADKEDLLKESIERLMAHLRQAAASSPRAAAKHPALGFVRPMLEHVHDMQVLFRALSNRPSGAAVQRQIHLALTEFVKHDLVQQRVHLQGSPELVAEFVVGAFLSVCFWWMSQDQRITVSEIEETFSGLLAPGLDRA